MYPCHLTSHEHMSPELVIARGTDDLRKITIVSVKPEENNVEVVLISIIYLISAILILSASEGYRSLETSWLRAQDPSSWVATTFSLSHSTTQSELTRRGRARRKRVMNMLSKTY